MIVEAADSNWFDQKNGPPFPNIYLRRLGARHGKKTADGANAWTNFAFFDGHVGLYATEPYTRKCTDPAKYHASSSDNRLPEYYTGTIFFLNKQRP